MAGGLSPAAEARFVRLLDEVQVPRLILLAATLAVFVKPIEAQRPATGQRRLQVRDSLVVLPDGRTFFPGLHRLRAHAILGAGTGSPFLLLSGFDCDDCDAPRAVYVLRAWRGTPGDQQPERPSFAYPGSVRDDENQVVASSRLFYGRCFGDSTLGVITFAHVKHLSGTWTDSSYVLRLERDTFVSSSAAYTRADLTLVRNRVKRGLCTELPSDKRQVVD